MALLRPSEVGTIVGVDLDRVGVLPKDWREWALPSPPLPIDKKIAELLARTCSPSLPADRRNDIKCPYYFARVAVARAAVFASHEEVRQKSLLLHIDSLKKMEKYATKAIASSEAIMKHMCEIDFETNLFGHFMDLDSEALSSKYLNKDKIANMSPLFIESLRLFKRDCHATANKISARRRKFEIWPASFAFHMGRFWFDLFDKNPATHNDSLFVKTIDAAFSSICYSSRKQSWDRPKTAAIERNKAAPDQLGFNRHALLVSAQADETEGPGFSEGQLERRRDPSGRDVLANLHSRKPLA